MPRKNPDTFENIMFVSGISGYLELYIDHPWQIVSIVIKT